VGSTRTPYIGLQPREEIGRTVIGRVQMYYADTRVQQILQKQMIAYGYHYDVGAGWAGWGALPPTNMMQRGGDQGELAVIRVNHFRNLVMNKVAMISNAKFERRPRAQSDDYDAVHATELCGYALDHYRQSGGLEQLRIQRIECGLLLGEGLTWYGWNPSRGRPYAINPLTKRMEYTGDIEASNVLSWDVARNPYKNWKDQPYLTVRFPNASKQILAAQFPEFAEAILDATNNTIVPFFTPSQMTSALNVDDVEVFRFIHRPCEIEGLEDGRLVTVLNTGVVLEDKPLDLRRFPLVRFTESPDVIGSAYGYASCWEYSGIQELYDALQSVVATNQSTFGYQNIAVKKGVDPRPMQLEGGLNVYECSDPKNDVVPLQLTKSPGEVFPHMDSLVRNMEKLSGVTQIDRGEAQGDRQAASAVALLSAQSIKNASPAQQSDVDAIREESQIILRLLRLHAKRPIPIAISERGQTPYERAIVGRDLGNVDDVDIELANPLQQTTEGRVAILQTFAQLKIELEPEQAMEVVKYGRLEPVTDRATKEGIRIRLENKMFLNGEVPRALITDDAIRHVKEHLEVLDDGGRDKPDILQAVFAHVDDHYRNFYGTGPEQDKLIGTYRPNMMVLAGLQPPPPAPGAMGGAPMPPPGTEGGAPPPEEGAPLPPAGPAQGPAAVLDQGGGPRLPKNAATGQRWTPVSGGGTPQA
jgi:hypothetical protein